MQTERSLIPNNNQNDIDYSSPIQTTANVVGAIPELVHAEVLAVTPSGAGDDRETIATNAIDGTNVTGVTNPRGRLDDGSSGISFLFENRGSNSEDGSNIYLWEHSTQTLSEDLVPPSLSWKLTHPEHPGDVSADFGNVGAAGTAGAAGRDLLVACVSGMGNTAGMGGVSDTPGSNRNYYEYHQRSVRHVYLASPISGVVCLWILDGTRGMGGMTNIGFSGSSGGMMEGGECDASLRLPLKPGEYLTALTPLSPSNSKSSSSSWNRTSVEWILAASSHGRIWKMYTTARPCGLHAKLVKGGNAWRNMSGTEVSAGGAEEGEEETGLVRGFYNSLFGATPKKSVTPGKGRIDGNAQETLPKKGSSFGDDGEIVSLVPLPPTVSDDEVGSAADDVTDGTPTFRSPPPRKVQRILTPDNNYSNPLDNSSRVLSLTSGLVLKEWKISLELDSSGGGSAEGCIRRTELFPRHSDGSLNITSIANSNSSLNGLDQLTGYHHADLLAPPSSSKDGSSLILAVRFAKHSLDDIDGSGVDGVDGSTRVYLLRLAIHPSNSLPHIVDAAWLDRYSGESLSLVGGRLECAGLVVAEENTEGMEGEGVEDGIIGNAANVTSDRLGGAVAYVGFGPHPAKGGMGQEISASHDPVTISAAHFPCISSTTNTENAMDTGSADSPRVKDLDLVSNVVPSIVNGSMSYDSTTGGCVFLSTEGLLGGVVVRFPIQPSSSSVPSTSTPMAPLAASVSEEAVLTIQSHLQSAFRQYFQRSREAVGGVNHASLARTIIPPSILAASSPILSAAVVRVSASMCNQPSGHFQESSNAMVNLNNKLTLHESFIQFLLHAGAYRKVSTAGRIGLRDHGEIIVAARATLKECQIYFSDLGKNKNDEDMDDHSQMQQLQQMVVDVLSGASDNVTDLPYRWSELQKLSAAIDPRLERNVRLLASSCICNSMDRAFGYRSSESNKVYDIPEYNPVVTSKNSKNVPAPWTSSPNVLEALQTQLELIGQAGDSLGDSITDLEAAQVEDMSMSLLAGYYDIVHREPNNVEAISDYEDAKILVVPLLRKFLNYEGKDDADIVALSVSLEHSFFEGIVQICHDHRRSWRFVGPFSPEDANEDYNIRPMLSEEVNGDKDDSFAHLHQSRDFKTGLPFREYVLKWYADHGYPHEVFELGKECPNTLSQYLRTDDRLSDLAWIQDVRTGSFEAATSGLLNLTSSVLSNKKEEDSPMGLWEKEQTMSLAKLSNMLAGMKSPTSVAGNQRSVTIENSLTLISAQRMLQEDDPPNDSSDIALSADNLLALAVDKIKSSRDLEDIKKYGICGLAIAHSVSTGAQRDMAAAWSNAALIWETLIQIDVQVWNSVARDNGMTAAGMAEEDLMRRVEETAFVGVAKDFAASSGDMREVGFLTSSNVKNNVVQSMGLGDDLVKLLVISAQLVS